MCVTEADHVKLILVKQFIGFLDQIEKSPKKLPLMLLQSIEHDVRSTTGYNLRKIMLLLKKTNIEDISKLDYRNIKYHRIKEADKWKIFHIQEITSVKFNQLDVNGFNQKNSKISLTSFVYLDDSFIS